MPVARIKITYRKKLMPAGFFQKRKSNAHPSRMTMSQNRFGLVFMHSLQKIFSNYSRTALAETLKRYHDFTKNAGYNLIRINCGLLTFDLNCDILPTSFRGTNNQAPSYRKEEVMSNMDSSNKPSAVASLLSK